MEIIEEVLDEIESALKSPKGIISHQRRLAFCLSLGIVYLLEYYLKKLNVFKKDTLCVGCARLGGDYKIVAGKAKDLLKVDFGKPLHCLQSNNLPC